MPEADLDLLVDAAQEAGKIARHYFRNDPVVREKQDNQGPVTEADIAVNDMLERDLRAARPDYGWLSEETEDSAARHSAERVFIVDPIDGTRSFIEGKTTFAHALAVARQGVVTAAVVYLPAEDKMFAASRGHGATLNGAPIQVADRSQSENADILTTKVNMAEGNWPGGVPEINRHFRSSLAYRLGLVAQGRFDGMITLRDTWEWDVAAGVLLVEEAGGIPSDRFGATPLFNNRHPQISGILAAGPTLHKDLISRM